MKLLYLAVGLVMWGCGRETPETKKMGSPRQLAHWVTTCEQRADSLQGVLDSLLRDSLRQNAPPDSCLYPTEYSVCLIRGHDDFNPDNFVWNGKPVRKWKCRWCGGTFKYETNTKTIELNPPTR